MDYPDQLHKPHNDHPLAAERVKIGNVENLIQNLKMTYYVVRYENLKCYESRGLKISKIHRGTKLKQSAWPEEYVNLSTNLRIEAKQPGNDFEEFFVKLMNNSVFGKTLQNIRTRLIFG